MTQKIFLLRVFANDHILQISIGYLAESATRKHLVIQILKHILRVWGDASGLRHTSYEQHFYLTRAIMVCISHLNEKDQASLGMELITLMMPSMQIHLDSNCQATRLLGMVVAETIAKFAPLSSPESGLKFEYEDTEDVLRLRKLLVKYEPGSDRAVNEIQSKLNNSSITENPEEFGKVVGATGQNVRNEDSDLDSDDDLEPYDLRNDIKVTKTKKPVYLRECMEGLLNAEDVDLVQVCLENAESLIRSHPKSAQEVALEFCKILLHLENKFSLNSFICYRHQSLVALTCIQPITIAEYLCAQFYDRNYNIRQRMDILCILSASAKELSDPNVKPNIVSKITEIPSKSPENGSVDNWQTVVQRRIDSNTRRFAHGRTQPEPIAQANKFAPVAGHFVFPLLRKFDDTDTIFDLLGTDHLLLSQLVYTLGCIMYSALHAPLALQIGGSLLEFLWVIRYHQQCTVRQAVLYAVCMVILSVPNHYLLTEFDSTLLEYKLWLEDVGEHDVDGECQERAVQALVLLQQAFKRSSQK